MKFLISLLGLPLGVTPTAAIQPPEDPVFYAFYSQEAAEKFGTVVYTNPQGEDVVATMVSHSPVPENYLWKDTQPLGVVTTFKRSYIRGIFR